MSENKTVVPGVNQEYSSATSSLYSRINTVAETKQRRTVVPGVDVSAIGSVEGGVKKNNEVSVSNAPVVGFLYSISRQGIGEYWPLHIGRNTIGRSAENDVCLAEASVSDHHASLNIKQMKSTKRILASIRDEGSSNGIFVNDEELDYSVHEVQNGDKILVGENYTLVLILIDSVALGLEVAPNFQSVENDEPGMEVVNSNYAGGLYDASDRPVGGTLAMDGTSADYGKTKYLD